MSQQDHGPSGHRRVYLTNKTVKQYSTTPGCSGCLGMGPHTEVCRVRLEKAIDNDKRVCNNTYRIVGSDLDRLPHVSWGQLYNLGGVRGKTPRAAERLPVVEELRDV